MIWEFYNDKEEIIMLDDGYIALGWKDMGDMSFVDKTRKAYYDRYNQVFPW